MAERNLSIRLAVIDGGKVKPTRSIAWAFADAVKSSYGAGLPDRQLDLSALARLDAAWSARGDTFNAVFDQNQTVWDALGQIARTGRAVPFLQGGIVRIVRDEPKTIPVALFSARNIVRNSWKIQYLMAGDATADAVTIEYVNPKSWKPDEFTVALPGSQAVKPARVRLFGCTDRAQGVREGTRPIKVVALLGSLNNRISQFLTKLIKIHSQFYIAVFTLGFSHAAWKQFVNAGNVVLREIG